MLEESRRRNPQWRLHVFLSPQSHDPDLSPWLHPADLDLCPYPVSWPVLLASGRGQRSDRALSSCCFDPAGPAEPIWRKRDHLCAAAPVAPGAPRHTAERRRRSGHDAHALHTLHAAHDKHLHGERFLILMSHISACLRSVALWKFMRIPYLYVLFHICGGRKYSIVLGCRK